MATPLSSLNYTPIELSFGTSGLRGLVSDMTDLECYVNTAGFVRFLEQTQGLERGAALYIAGDLRDSTPRILRAVMQSVRDKGYNPVYLGLIPTPAAALYGLARAGAAIMVTGSHIPADRNGIKFYKLGGEVLKADERAIKEAVAWERAQIMKASFEASPFDEGGALKVSADIPEEVGVARTEYLERYLSVFARDVLTNKKVVVYQHSAVGRDLLVELFEGLGADVVTVGRSDTFIPIDTENVTPADQEYFASLAGQHSDVFAIVSTDGDSDRPFVIDEKGAFHRGDELGAVIAKWLGADFAAIPVSSSDAVDEYLRANNVAFTHTKIGSPHVIVAMQAAVDAGSECVVGWEVNGGFLLGADVSLKGGVLGALPTRDAFLPIIVALVAAVEQNVKPSEVFAQLPARFTQAGLIDDFPIEISKRIVADFSEDSEANRHQLGQYFTRAKGFGAIQRINSLDGIRIFFDNEDIAHLRPSGNAPQMRVYSVANTQERANEIVKLGIEPNGILESLKEA